MEKRRWLYKSKKKKKGPLFDLRAKENEGESVLYDVRVEMVKLMEG